MIQLHIGLITIGQTQFTNWMTRFARQIHTFKASSHCWSCRRDRREISCCIINFHGAAKICPTKRTNCSVQFILQKRQQNPLIHLAQKKEKSLRFNWLLNILWESGRKRQKDSIFPKALSGKIFLPFYKIEWQMWKNKKQNQN